MLLLAFGTAAMAQSQAGAISGVVGFPGEEIPPLRIYALAQDGKSHYSVSTARNQAKFSIPGIAPGSYYVVAYPANKADTDVPAGGWTRFVPCGMRVQCQDHSLIPVNVAEGKTAGGINIADWYAQAGAFPPEPVRGDSAVSSAGCAGKGSQLEEDACNLKAYEAADRLLNTEYRRVAGLLEPKCQERLRESQRAWIRFRDGHCKFEAATGYKGRMTECLGQLTAQRAAYLKQQSPELCNP